MRCRPGDLQQIYLSVCLGGLGCHRYLTLCNRSYPEILGMHVKNLASVLIKANSEETQNQLDERLQAFAAGEIDHASDAFSSLWRVLVQRKSSESVQPRSDAVRPSCLRRWFILMHVWQSGSPPSAGSPLLNTALIKSIRQGLFCDRRYLVKLEDTEKRRVPIYVSSAVLGGVEDKLNIRKPIDPIRRLPTLSKYLK